MIKKHNSFILLFFFCSIIVGQNNNLKIVNNLILKGELETSIKMIDSLLKEDLSLKDTGYLKLEKAKIYRIKGEDKSFIREIKTVFTIAEKTENKLLEADAWFQKIIYFNSKKGQGLPALANYISIAESTKNNRLLYISYKRLTFISLKSNSTKKARIFYKKAEKAFRNLNKKTENDLYLNLLYANILKKEQQYDSAVVYLKKMLFQTKEANINTDRAQALSLLGFTELKNKNYEASFNWSLASNKLSNKIDYQLFKESSYANIYLLLLEPSIKNNKALLTKIYSFFEASSLKEATINVEKKLGHINKIAQKLKVLHSLSFIYKKIGNLEKALFYNEEWSKLKIERFEKDQLDIHNFMNLELAISNLNVENKNLEIENKLNFTHKIILILSLFILLILALLIWSQQRLKIKNEKLSKLTAERNFLNATKERIRLEKTLAQKELELNSFIREMIEKNSQIEILNEKLKKSKTVNSDKLIEELNSEKSLASKNWIEFTFKFKQLYPGFLKKLKTVIPNISPTETKLSILAFMNLSSKEIANILNISATSVNQGKYRLKKKISLEKEMSLTNFLQKL